MKIGWEAMRIALPGYVWPFMAVYSPQLMLQPVAGLEGGEYWFAVAFVAVKAVLTIGLWGAAAFGWLFGRMAWWERHPRHLGRSLPRRLAAARRRHRLPARRRDCRHQLVALAAGRNHRHAGMSLCIAAAGFAVELAVSSFSLAWTHTIEKTEWQEEWRIEGDLLRLVEARVEGSGAGMEPPPDAQLTQGFYVWTPSLAPQTKIVLRRAPQAGDWRLCADGRCAPLGAWLGGDADPVTLRAAENCRPL